MFFVKKSILVGQILEFISDKKLQATDINIDNQMKYPLKKYQTILFYTLITTFIFKIALSLLHVRNPIIDNIFLVIVLILVAVGMLIYYLKHIIHSSVKEKIYFFCIDRKSVV